MASELRVDTLKDSSGNNSVGMSYVAEGSAKSWCHIDGEGTPVISGSGSFNVSSLTDVTTSQIGTNFTNNMADDDYSATGTPRENGFVAHWQELDTTNPRTSSYFNSTVHNGAHAQADCDGRSHTIHGDLA